MHSGQPGVPQQSFWPHSHLRLGILTLCPEVHLSGQPLSDYDSGDWGISQLTLGLFSLSHRQLSLDTDTTSLTLLEHMVQGPTNTVHSGWPGVPHSHLRDGFRVSVWTQQLRELIQLNQLTTYKSLPPHPTHRKSRSVIPKKKTQSQSPLASSWSVNQPELCSELCSEDCLTAACLALHLLRAVLRGLPDGSLLGTTFAQSFAQRSA